MLSMPSEERKRNVNAWGLLKRRGLLREKEIEGLNAGNKASIEPDINQPDLDPPQKIQIRVPLAIPKRERASYVRIRLVREKFQLRMLKRWREFVDDFTGLEKVRVPREQSLLYESLLTDYNVIATDMFGQGVSEGNRYFEDQFRVTGISRNQQTRLVNKHVNIFEQRSRNLFFEDASTLLAGSGAQTPQEEREFFTSFERHIIAYANVAVSIAYDAFLRGTTLLNSTIADRFEAAGIGVPEIPVKVVWILADQSEHSFDCEVMSRGEEQDGSGIWDPRSLAEMDLYPTSPELDCGGACHCHLSPFIPLTEVTANFMDAMIPVPDAENILNVIPDLSRADLLKLFSTKGFTLADDIAEFIAGNSSLRRSELWKGINAFEVRTSLGPEFLVLGRTDARVIARNLIRPDRITIDIFLPEGLTLARLSATQRAQILNVLAHEFGHTVAFPLKTGVVSNMLTAKQAEAIFAIAAKERTTALAQISVNFEKAIAKIPRARISKQIQADIAVMRAFLSDPELIIERLVSAIKSGARLPGGLTGQDAWRLLERVVTQYSTGVKLTSVYSLRNVEEYFAEWFSQILTNPTRAAFLSPPLNRQTAKSFSFTGRQFFGTKSSRRARSLLPDSAAITTRLDVPTGSAVNAVAPSLKTFAGAAQSATSETARLTTEQVRRQLATVIKRNPMLQRNEFYGELNITFIDRIQMGKRSGIRNNIGFFEDGQFVLNADVWKFASVDRRTEIISDLIADHLWTVSKPAFRSQITDFFVDDYLFKTMDYLGKHTAIQNLPSRHIEDLRRAIYGTPSARTRNLSIWVDNFEPSLRPVIQNMTDLPIMNIDSLASPKDFWRNWFRLYVTKPEVATFYSQELFEIFAANLRIGVLRKMMDYFTGGWHAGT